MEGQHAEQQYIPIVENNQQEVFGELSDQIVGEPILQPEEETPKPTVEIAPAPIQSEVQQTVESHTPLNTNPADMPQLADIMKALGEVSPANSQPIIEKHIEQAAPQPNLIQKIGLLLKHLFTFWKKKEPIPTTA